MSRVFSRLLRSNTTLPLLLEMGLATISWGETSLEKPSWQTSNSRAWSHGRTTLVGTQRKGRGEGVCVAKECVEKVHLLNDMCLCIVGKLRIPLEGILLFEII